MQTARGPLWLTFALALVVAGFAFIFLSTLPGVTSNIATGVVWFVGVWLVSVFAAYFGLVFTTGIVQVSDNSFALTIPDHYSNTSTSIDFDWIQSVELCHYPLTGAPSDNPHGINNDYWIKKTLLGYVGPGLIVGYRLPKTMSQADIVRGVQFPAPKAEMFLQYINANAPGLSQISGSI